MPCPLAVDVTHRASHCGTHLVRAATRSATCSGRPEVASWVWFGTLAFYRGVMPASHRAVTQRRLALCALGALAISACSDASQTGPDVTLAVATSTTAAPRAADGTLRIATVMPMTGSGARLGVPLAAAVESAIEEINRGGGVLGRTVDLVQFDEVTTTDLTQVRDADVDAVIGPASSLIALSTLSELVSTPMLACSPTATAITLDDAPDQNLMFRTVGSDSAQMSALARTASRTGNVQAVVTHLDDPYGRDLADEFSVQLVRRGTVTVVDRVDFAADDPDLSDEAARILAENPGVVAVLADGDDGGRMIAALDAAIGSAEEVPTIVVNDGLRTATEVMAQLQPTTRDAIIGVAARSIVPGIDPPGGHFATNAHDCAMLIALSAVQAGTDDPRAIAARLPSVSTGGRVCTQFTECRDAIAAGLQIDYNGLSGNVELSATTGDLQRAWFVEFTFGDDGREVVVAPTGVEIS